jgi:RelE toxin of RelE / RelB toxin-antitoxin system
LTPLETGELDRNDKVGLRGSLPATPAAEPERHPVIPGTGGFRKARWRRPGGGKSGGVRVIYYFMVRPDVVFLADLYAKNEKENLTHAERNQLQKIASEIQREFGG